MAAAGLLKSLEPPQWFEMNTVDYKVEWESSLDFYLLKEMWYSARQVLKRGKCIPTSLNCSELSEVCNSDGFTCVAS